MGPGLSLNGGSHKVRGEGGSLVDREYFLDFQGDYFFVTTCPKKLALLTQVKFLIGYPFSYNLPMYEIPLIFLLKSVHTYHGYPSQDILHYATKN